MLRVPYGLSVYDTSEIQAVVKVLSEHRSNMGIETEVFESRIAKIMGCKYGVMVNSGSSAILIAIELLNLPKGAEIITPALTFSTTVAPIIQHGLIPVFADVLPGQYIINVDQVKSLITKKTKALLIPLLLGNVPEMDKLERIAKKYNLSLVVDSCDTIGATYKVKSVGSFSDISATSFFGSHIITTGGNGGMLMVNNPLWRDRAKVLRGWGRNSSLFSESEDITKRFRGKIDSIPYDSKFIFDEIGYNFLPNEMCAAFGNIQLKKLARFRKTREMNFSNLKNFFKKYQDFFIIPEQTENTQTQWLAFPLTIRKNAPFTRISITTFLEKNNVQTRPVFTGNITRQPGFKKQLLDSRNEKFPVADDVMERGFVVGCHHGLEDKHINRLKKLFTLFLKQY